jgi:hypothetical protein
MPSLADRNTIEKWPGADRDGARGEGAPTSVAHFTPATTAAI